MASLIKKAPKRMRKRNHPIQCFFSRKAVNNALLNKLEEHYRKPSVDVAGQAKIPATNVTDGVSSKEIRDRLDLIKKYI